MTNANTSHGTNPLTALKEEASRLGWHVAPAVGNCPSDIAFDRGQLLLHIQSGMPAYLWGGPLCRAFNGAPNAVVQLLSLGDPELSRLLPQTDVEDSDLMVFIMETVNNARVPFDSMGGCRETRHALAKRVSEVDSLTLPDSVNRSLLKRFFSGVLTHGWLEPVITPSGDAVSFHADRHERRMIVITGPRSHSTGYLRVEASSNQARRLDPHYCVDLLEAPNEVLSQIVRPSDISQDDLNNYVRSARRGR